MLTLIGAIIWTLYFSKARRVRLVFIEKNWKYIPYSERRALNAEEKKKLRNRSLVFALVTFFLLLLIMGYVLKDEGKSLDTGIFALPLFYALVVAVIAWYLPVRKKQEKKSSLENPSKNTEVEKP